MASMGLNLMNCAARRTTADVAGGRTGPQGDPDKKMALYVQHVGDSRKERDRAPIEKVALCRYILLELRSG